MTLRACSNKKSLVNHGLVCLLALLITGCGTPVKSLPDSPFNSRVTDSRALRQLNKGNPQAAADIYSARAARSSSAAQSQDYLLIATEILFDRAMIEPGNVKLASIPETMATPALQQRREIVASKSLLLGGDPTAALNKLPDPGVIESSLDRARVYETRAQAFSKLDDPANELIARINMENQLSNALIVDKNHTQIWSMLTTQPVSRLRSLTTNVSGDVYQGWIELALLNASAGSNQQLRAQKLDQWRGLFATHPANERFVPLMYANGQQGDFQMPTDGPIEQIAVLLPLSDSRTATVAGALRDGIIAAHQNATDRINRPRLRFYDVGENPAYVRTAFQNALTDGADAIVGPLRKPAVSAIVSLRDVPVPTVTLNTVDASLRNSQNQSRVIQFGLAPEDEARSAASRAIALSMPNAIILQADDSRGDREARAFQEAMFQYGGDVVHLEVLPKDEYDYSQQIKDALLITQSDERFRALSSTLGEKLFFEPGIRDDVDVIFLALGSEQARSVRPQLDFFHATGVTRLGTSRVAGPDDDQKKNRDLNSIYYPDAPWVLRKSLRKDPLRAQILKSFPAANGVYAKIYALGADAYKVITSLPALANGERLAGFTGDLELNSDGHIQRYLDWAQYQEGISVPVKSVEAEPVPDIRSGAIN